jgi:hypothetical protein
MTGSSAFSAAPWLRRIAGSACAREDGSAERAPLTDAPHHDCVEAKAAAIMVSRKDQHHHEQEEIGPGPFAGRTVEAEPKIENLQRADVFNKRMKTPSINDTPVKTSIGVKTRLERYSSGIPARRRPAKYVASTKARIFGTPQDSTARKRAILE